jgi:hypothetical protein
MWRITSIINLDRDHDIDKLLLNINTGNYAVLFYNTVTKVSEEVFMELGVGYWIITINRKRHDFVFWFSAMKFICTRYNWHLEHISPALYVADKYFMKVEEKLKMLSPFKEFPVYRYGNNSSAVTLKDMFDSYDVAVKNGEVRVSDARFKLLCSEDEFKVAYTKYCIMRGKINVE